MPSQARNTTKKAPPRAKEPNSSSRKGKGTKKATSKSRKRAATESDSDESESEDEPKKGKAPRRKKARVTERNDESNEVEEVDDVDSVPPPEEISDDEVNLGNENEPEVSKKNKKASYKNSQDC